MNYFIEPLLSSVNGNCADTAVFLGNISDIYLPLFFNSNLWWKYSQYFFKADIQLSFLTKARSLNQILTICDTAVYPNHLLPMSLCHFLEGEKKSVHQTSRLEGLGRLVCLPTMGEEKGKSRILLWHEWKEFGKGLTWSNKAFVYFEGRDLHFCKEKTSLDICCFQDNTSTVIAERCHSKCWGQWNKSHCFTWSVRLLECTVCRVDALLGDSAHFLWYLLVLNWVEYLSPNKGGRIIHRHILWVRLCLMRVLRPKGRGCDGQTRHESPWAGFRVRLTVPVSGCCLGACPSLLYWKGTLDHCFLGSNCGIVCLAGGWASEAMGALLGTCFPGLSSRRLRTQHALSPLLAWFRSSQVGVSLPKWASESCLLSSRMAG